MLGHVDVGTTQIYTRTWTMSVCGVFIRSFIRGLDGLFVANRIQLGQLSIRLRKNGQHD